MRAVGSDDHSSRLVGTQDFSTNAGERAENIGTRMSVLVTRANGNDSDIRMDGSEKCIAAAR